MGRLNRPKHSSPIGNYGLHVKLAHRQTDFAGTNLRGIFFADAKIHGADFENAVFEGCQLARGSFGTCNFRRTQIRQLSAQSTRFSKCQFEKTSMDFADVRMVDFESCQFDATSFRNANLEGVTFTDCYVAGVSFASARLEGVRFTASHIVNNEIAGASFIDCDVTAFSGQGRASLAQGACFDWKTIGKSLRAVHLPQLLRASGIPEIMAMYMVDAAKALDPLLLFKLMRSTFISYGAPDARFARVLRDRLQANGVRTFFFETDAIPGERLHRVMRRGVNEHDRVILVCSAVSLNRRGVRNEIEETLAREARDGGASYLIPVVLDDYLFEWSDSLGDAIRDRVVADFRKPKKKTEDTTAAHVIDLAFEEGLGRLLKALQIG